MFYIKNSFGYADVVTELKRDNIFTKCHECEKEIKADLARLAKGHPEDILGVLMLCDECGEKYIHQYPDKTPPTLGTIKYLVALLKEKGFDDEVAFMYNTYEITSLDNLDEADYDEFAANLIDGITGELDKRYGKKGER